MEEQLKRIILSTNLTGKLTETIWLLQEVYSDEQIKANIELILKAIDSLLKVPAENRKVVYYNSNNPKKLERVKHWDYKKEDFE